MAKSIEGGVIIVNTLSTKNDGNYPLCMAESVNLADGRNVEKALMDIASSSGASNSNYYFSGVELVDGAEAPTGMSINDFVMDVKGSIFKVVLGDEEGTLKIEKQTVSFAGSDPKTITEDEISALFPEE